MEQADYNAICDRCQRIPADTTSSGADQAAGKKSGTPAAENPVPITDGKRGIYCGHPCHGNGGRLRHL